MNEKEARRAAIDAFKELFERMPKAMLSEPEVMDMMARKLFMGSFNRTGRQVGMDPRQHMQEEDFSKIEEETAFKFVNPEDKDDVIAGKISVAIYSSADFFEEYKERANDKTKVKYPDDMKLEQGVQDMISNAMTGDLLTDEDKKEDD